MGEIRRNMRVRLPDQLGSAEGVAMFMDGSGKDWAVYVPGPKHPSAPYNDGFLVYCPPEWLEPLDTLTAAGRACTAPADGPATASPQGAESNRSSSRPVAASPGGGAGVTPDAGPKRIQRRRTRGWRMPEGAVYVGRPTVWGNPWAVGDGYRASVAPACDPARNNGRVIGPEGCFVSGFVESAAQAVALYEGAWLTEDLREDARTRLAGKDLACWCPLDQPCHADVLLEVANTPAAEGVQP